MMAYAIGGLLLGIVGWTIAGTVQPVLLSTPIRSFDALMSVVADGSLGRALAESGVIFGIGLSLSIVVGVGYGILVTRLLALREATQWLVFALQAVPVIAVAPIILAVAGFGVGAKSFVVFVSAVFPIMINTMEGARNAPQDLLDVAHMYRSSERQIWEHVLLPHTVPYAMTGVRQGIAAAFVGTLVAEFFLNASGVGGLMVAASARLDTASVLALTIFVAVIAVLLMAAGRLLERFFARWREETPS
jgi:ABC-type nitrate/sulfonate/bicarbonate transport system permease component